MGLIDEVIPEPLGRGASGRAKRCSKRKGNNFKESKRVGSPRKR